MSSPLKNKWKGVVADFHSAEAERRLELAWENVQCSLLLATLTATSHPKYSAGLDTLALLKPKGSEWQIWGTIQSIFWLNSLYVESRSACIRNITDHSSQ